MAKLQAICHTDQLGALVTAARADGNRTLDALVRQRRSDAQARQLAPFLFVPVPGQPPQAIPAAQFQQPYRLALAEVELTLHGYCVQHRSGSAARLEAEFRLGRPPLWRRLLRPAPPLALRICAGGGTVAVDVAAKAAWTVAVDPQRRIVLLAPPLQDALLRLHLAQQGGSTWRSRFKRWIRP